MLNTAFKAADAPRVVAFFRGFLAEEAATGHAPAPANVQPPPAPRTPAVDLAALAAPGRAQPATGNQLPGTPPAKPVYTHAQIAAFYDAVRRGHYEGRNDERQALEADLIAAGREGRVR